MADTPEPVAPALAALQPASGFVGGRSFVCASSGGADAFVPAAHGEVVAATTLRVCAHLMPRAAERDADIVGDMLAWAPGIFLTPARPL